MDLAVAHVPLSHLAEFDRVMAVKHDVEGGDSSHTAADPFFLPASQAAPSPLTDVRAGGARAHRRAGRGRRATSSSSTAPPHAPAKQRQLPAPAKQQQLPAPAEPQLHCVSLRWSVQRQLPCAGRASPPPLPVRWLAEFNLANGGAPGRYGISVVDRFTLPMDFSCSGAGDGGVIRCRDPGCPDGNHRPGEGKYRACPAYSDYQVVFCP
mgnify:CR=1 FL=1